MTDHPKWMPSESEIREACAAASWGERSKIRALIRAAVEEALAERDSAATTALDQIATVCGCPTWEYPGQVVRDVEKALAEQEARHKREVLEARIYECEKYGDCICERYSDPTLNVRHRDCEVCKHLDSLRAELAAMEVKP